MGMVYSLFVGPTPPKEIPIEGTISLITDLCNKRIVEFPFEVIENNDDRFPFNSTKTWAKGKTLTDPLNAIGTIPFGQADLCVSFFGFDPTNEDLMESFIKHDFANVDYVMLYFPREQRTIPLNFWVSDGPNPWEGHYETRDIILHHYFCSSGSNGPQHIEGTLLEPVLKEHYGENLIVDFSPEFYD